MVFIRLDKPPTNVYNVVKMKKHNWDKRTLNKLYHAEGKTLREIGTIYGVTRERIRQVMEEYSLSRNTKRASGGRKKGTFIYHSLHEYAKSNGKRQNTNVLRRFIKPTVCSECGNTHNLHLHHIVYPATSLNDIQILCASCHSRKHKTGITFAQQLDIFNLYCMGTTTIELASEYNVSRNLIYLIITKIKNNARTLRG